MYVFRFSSLLFLFFGFYQAAVMGQIRLVPVDSFSAAYVVQFSAAPTVLKRLRSRGSRALTALKTRQAGLLKRLEKDLQQSDYRILTSLWINQSVVLHIAEKELERLRSLSYVHSVRAEQRYQRQQPKKLLPPLGLLKASRAHLNQIQLNQLWNRGFKGQGVVVAVLDSGVDVSHSALAHRWRGGSNSWFDPYAENDQPIDLSLNGHGTQVTSLIMGGTVAGQAIGVAPESRFIAAKIFNNQGSSTESAIHSVFQWLLDPDGDPNTDDYPDIVNNSWGVAGSEGVCDVRYKNDLELLSALGIDIVFAAGNAGDGLSSHLIPTFDSNVISVGAVDDNNIIWLNSGRGPNRCENGSFPSLVAPGVNLKAAGLTLNGLSPNKLEVVEGTSFSAPLVSGALALLRSHFETNENSTALFGRALFDAALDLGVLGDDDSYGRGLLNINKADDLLAAQLRQKTLSEVGFGKVKYRLSESLNSIDVHVLRSGDVSAAAQVRVQSIDGSAVAGDDYIQHSVLLNFQPEESFKTITVLLLDDLVVEGDEYFLLRLSENSNVVLTAQAELKVTLLDDDVTADGVVEPVGGALSIVWLLLFLPLCFRREQRC